MMEWLVVAWLVLVVTIALNGFAAGVVAILHAWRSRLRRGARTFLACAVAGFLPGSMVIAFAIAGTDEFDPSADPVVFALTFAVFFAIGMVISLPGGIIVARKFQAPGDDFKAFE